MASAGSLIFELAADVSRLRTDMGKAQSEIKSALDSISKSTAASSIMAGAEWAKGFAEGFAEKIKQAIDNADALGKLSQSIGTTTEQLSALTYAGEFAGVSTDDLATAFKGLNKALLEARDPASDASAAFKALGLNVKDLQAMDPADAFKAIAESMSGFEDGAQKSAAAAAIFGKSAQVLIPLLDEGADGIAKATEEAEKMGLIVSGETSAAMADLNDDLTRMAKLSEGSAAVLARELQPAFAEVMEIMKEAATEGTTWNSVLEGIAITAKAVIGTLVGMVGTVTALGKLVMGFAKILNQPINAEGMKKAGEIWADSMQGAQKTIKETEDHVTKLVHVQTAAEKAAAGMATAWGIVGKNAEKSGKATLDFTGQVDKAAASAKKGKQAVDEYAKMVDSLSEQYRKLAAEGDPMKELTSDPKFLAMGKAQQDDLIARTKANIALATSIDARKQAEEDAYNVDATAYKASVEQWKAEEEHAKQIWDWADQQRRAVDPMIDYTEQVDKLNEALKEGAIPTTEDYLAILKKINDEYDQSVEKSDPMLDQLKEIEKAIDAFGKQSSDAFVDFVFGTKGASQSFSEMVASMLKDIAKMLVYQNVIKPMFSAISTGATSGWGSLVSSLTTSTKGAGMMAGGMVSPGVVYPINEIPGRAEFFIPNVPGKVVTDAGAGMGGPNVVVNVHMDKHDKATEETSANQKMAAEFGQRIASVVKQVIVTERRTGGLLAPKV